MNKKVCIKCNKEKPIIEFYKPYFSHCLECTKILKNKELLNKELLNKDLEISSFNYTVWFNQLSERRL